jgi:hypothetical protein
MCNRLQKCLFTLKKKEKQQVHIADIRKLKREDTTREIMCRWENNIKIIPKRNRVKAVKGKAVPQHTYGGTAGRRGIAPTH